ncbi:Protein AF-9 [Apostichopus japonicus]|uniref:Protein AF-9 n=1 Tax=Stichopus japonicus TaxID=307972 RepID=A0A2G8LGC7_STIJA|nr:Protein AF-9 [Apostichopus japonicus]
MLPVVKEAPFVLEESGYGGFTMPIEIHLKNREEPKKVQFVYDLFLHIDGDPPVNHVRGEKLTFRNPTEDFRRKLLSSGGVGVLDDGGIPPGASFGLESVGTINSTGVTDSRTPSKGKPGAVSTNVAQKKLKTTAAPTKDPSKSSSSKGSKEFKEGKVSSKEGKSSSKVASKRPSQGSSRGEPSVKRKKDYSLSTKSAKSTSSEKSSAGNEQSSKKGPSTAKKKKSLPKVSKEKKAELFLPEISVEHKTKSEPVKKPSLPPFEDEVSTGEVDAPDSPSSKSTGSFSSLPRGGGTGGALETLMAEIADDYEDEEDQDYNIPFKRDFPNSSIQSLEHDSSSSGSDFDQLIRQTIMKKENSSKRSEKPVKEETMVVEKKSKFESKTKSEDGKKSWTKPKDSDSKAKTTNVRKKSVGNEKGKTSSAKSKASEKKESKAAESKAKLSSNSKPKKSEKPKTETKRRSAEGKSKVSESKTKSDGKVKTSDGKTKESSKENEKKGVQTNNMDYLYELVDLHKRLMALKDREKLQKVVDLIGETGDFKITDKTFDFDLCSLDKPTVRKLQEYVPPL